MAPVEDEQRAVVLEDFEKWMSDNGHEIEQYQDYGDCGYESIQCSARTCPATKYDYIATHVKMYLEGKR